MFTGLVSHSGRVVVEPSAHGSSSLEIEVVDLDEPLGASIAVDGCCLTVARRTAGSSPRSERYGFDVLPETIAHTTIGDRRIGDFVNLEPALRVGDALGGHWVQGHVDDVGVVERVDADPDGRWTDVAISVPEHVHRLCAERGSIAVNGTSLTVMEVTTTGVRLQLIPETCARTNLGALAVGDRVNLEADIVARYVARLASALG